MVLANEHVVLRPRGRSLPWHSRGPTAGSAVRETRVVCARAVSPLARDAETDACAVMVSMMVVVDCGSASIRWLLGSSGARLLANSCRGVNADEY